MELFVKLVLLSLEPSGDQTKLNPTPQDQLPPTDPEADSNTFEVPKQSRDLDGLVTVETNASSKVEALVGPEGEFQIFYDFKYNFGYFFSRKKRLLCDISSLFCNSSFMFYGILIFSCLKLFVNLITQ